ncbi:MAG: hypothetical protein ACRELB_00275 [Polyangiaceae bacterium]
MEHWFFALHELPCAPGQHTLHVAYRDSRSFFWHDATTPVLVAPEQITHVHYEPHLGGHKAFKILGTWPMEAASGPTVSVPVYDGSHLPARVVGSVDAYTLVQLPDGKQRWYTTSLVKQA